MSATMQRLKSRIRTAKNIAQITKAMELVAASKMRRAQIAAVSGKPFTDDLTQAIQNLAQARPAFWMFDQRQVGSQVVVIIAPDRGLAGSLPNQTLLKADKLIQNLQYPQIITVGRLARDYASRSKLNLIASFTDIPDKPTSRDLKPLADFLTKNYLSQNWQSIDVVYPEFYHTMKQEPLITRVLPMAINEQDTQTLEYTFEPQPIQVLEALAPYYILNRIYQLMLECRASEHSARMMAMKQAREAATERNDELTLMYNQQRQGKITGELLDAISARLTVN